MDGCHNCVRLCSILKSGGFHFVHYDIDRSETDLATAESRKIMDYPFPVVFINGRRLPPDTPEGYLDTIRRAKGEREYE